MRKQARQKQLPFLKGWGGRRKGSGRKLQNARPSVPHRTRVELDKPAPLHVNVRLKDGLPSLRRGPEHQTFRRVLARCRERKSFRVVHYVILFSRVGPDRCRPGPPTDPDVRDSRIRLLRIAGSLRAAKGGVDGVSRRQAVARFEGVPPGPVLASCAAGATHQPLAPE